MDCSYTVKRARVRGALSRSGLPGLDYALNPYVGCSHACIYCYGREYVRNEEVARSWGSVVVVKENLVEVLRKETSSVALGTVGLGTITDAYQPVERSEAVSRRSLEVLLSRGFGVSIQTKSSLVLRDVDLLEAYSSRVDVGFTITTLDESLAELIEPCAPPPSERARALEELSSRGIETWIFLGPIIPGVNDEFESIEEIIELASSTESVLYVDKLRVKPFMMRAEGPIRDYVAKARSYDWGRLLASIEELCEKRGAECRGAFEIEPESATSSRRPR
ncbi:MAG: radical SAM protein [Fervidicoccaceae archaeon]